VAATVVLVVVVVATVVVVVVVDVDVVVGATVVVVVATVVVVVTQAPKATLPSPMWNSGPRLDTNAISVRRMAATSTRGHRVPIEYW
jgi:hypothetical protein